MLFPLSHTIQIALDSGMEGCLVQLDFLAAFDKFSHFGLLYKLRSTGLSIGSEILSDRS